MRVCVLMLLFVSSLSIVAKAGFPCWDDIQRSCPGATPQNGLAAKCINENKVKFSAACLESKKKDARQAEEKLKICKGDIKKFCPTEKTTEQIVTCLQKNKKELTKTCLNAPPAGLL